MRSKANASNNQVMQMEHWNVWAGEWNCPQRYKKYPGGKVYCGVNDKLCTAKNCPRKVEVKQDAI